MKQYQKKLVVKNCEHFSLPHINDYRSLSHHKEQSTNSEDCQRKYFSFIYPANSTPTDKIKQQPQHMRNIQRRNQMLKFQLKRVSDQIKKVSPPHLQYETLEEIYFIRYRKII